MNPIDWLSSSKYARPAKQGNHWPFDLRQFAKDYKLSYIGLTRVLKGRKRTFEIARIFYEASEGAVGIDGWIALDPERQKKGKTNARARRAGR